MPLSDSDSDKIMVRIPHARLRLPPLRRNSIDGRPPAEADEGQPAEVAERRTVQRIPFPSVALNLSRYIPIRVRKKSKCTSPSCFAKGVVDLLARRPSIFTFKEACAVLAHCDLDVHFRLTMKLILNYSLKIYGFPECSSEDLMLAAYFFIEDVFGIKSKIELCVRYDEDDEDTNLVGIVFDSVRVARDILKKASCLEGTSVSIQSNYDVDWILDGFCLKSPIHKHDIPLPLPDS